MKTHEKLYAKLLALFPGEFVAIFGEEMLATFVERCDATSGMRRRLLVARELLSLPVAALRLSLERASSVSLPEAAALGASTVAAALVSSRMITITGFAHGSAAVLLALLLVAAGVSAGLRIAGAGARTFTLFTFVLLSFSAFAPFSLDRALTSIDQAAGHEASLTLPGVRVVSFAASSATAAKRLSELGRAAHMHDTTTFTGESARVHAVRSGGTDGLYAALALMLVAGAASATFHIASARVRMA